MILEMNMIMKIIKTLSIWNKKLKMKYMFSQKINRITVVKINQKR